MSCYIERYNLKEENMTKPDKNEEKLMTGLEEKVAAGIALKATDSIVKIFFTPHIKSLKGILKEKNLEKQISDKNLEKIFNNYFTSLYNSCGIIKTIVFPHKDIPLDSVYEPLHIVEKNIYNSKVEYIRENKNLIFLTNRLSSDDLSKNIVLIDSAGMGKSTFCKYLIIRTLNNASHNKIPIFVELRKIDKDQSLINYMTKAINLKHNNILTEEMFLRLVEKGKFIFFLDGFDVSPKLTTPKTLLAIN